MNKRELGRSGLEVSATGSVAWADVVRSDECTRLGHQRPVGKRSSAPAPGRQCRRRQCNGGCGSARRLRDPEFHLTDLPRVVTCTSC
jgi:hypothetical protein